MPWGYAAAAVSLYGSATAGGDARDAARTEADAQREALDYQREVEALPLEIRNQFLPMLADFYSGGEGQNALIEDVRSSPFYDQMIQQGQEGVLAQAGARGLTRSGNTTQDLNQSNQGVLQNLVNQRLQGMQGLAQQPLNTNSIANSMSGIGQTLAAGQTAGNQANQDGLGMLAGMLQSYSDEKLKTNVKFIRKAQGHKIYSWDWNKLANKTLNLFGSAAGVIAQEVEKYNPKVVGISKGFKTVNYGELFNG